VADFWIDAQLPPQLASWIHDQFGYAAFALRDLGLRDASDLTIFEEAKKSGTILISKDLDFVELIGRFGAPPKLIWITCGNVSNDALKTLLKIHLDEAIRVLESDDIVEIGG
jgi:predicted nuclease of predicted toxin-antitoxin system